MISSAPYLNLSRRGITPGRPVRIVVRVQLVGPVVVITTLIILKIVFPIIGTLIMTSSLPIGIVVRVHLIGPVVIISRHCTPPTSQVE